MKAYSVDLRQRVADAVLLDGLTWAVTARLFRLSVASVGRFVLARRSGRPLRVFEKFHLGPFDPLVPIETASAAALGGLDRLTVQDDHRRAHRTATAETRLLIEGLVGVRPRRPP